VMQVMLRLPVVERLRFHPGQYLDVLLENGRRRSFSIASPPHDSELIELHVRRVAGGGFTERLFGGTHQGTAALGAGSLLRIEGPIGQFTYRAGSGPVLMIAGGTGFAPLKAMLRHVLEGNIRRPIHLYWGARHAQDLYERAQVQRWVRDFPHFSFTPVLSQPELTGSADARTGWVHQAVLADHAH
jgi:CDP-4-dehydro-6-deoxyglucose reductase, E3